MNSRKPLISDNSRVADVLENPIGFDVAYKLMLQMGKPFSKLNVFFIRNMKMKTVKWFARKTIDPSFFDCLYELLNQEPERLPLDKGEVSKKWWKEAVFYQIYPKSFKDSNADGIGDLNGISSKLDYLKELGVDAIWLSPIYDSPLDDNGYDIRDYRKILAEFGTMEDFDNLLVELKKRDMKIILDLVVNHSSDEHEWYKKAISDKDSKYHDYYIFKENKGAMPNNWTSFFSGPAWKYVPETDEYALKLFSSKQMDLNWENPELRAEVADIVRFWRDKGIDCFRMDVINYIAKNSFEDGNNTIGELMGFYGVERYFFGEKLHEYLHDLKVDAFGDMFNVGETPGVGFEMSRLLTHEDRQELDTVFLFDHLETPSHNRFDAYKYDLNFLKRYYADMYEHLGTKEWPSLFFENHDNPRMISKVSSDEVNRNKIGKLLATFMLTLRGTPFIYQGQELGMLNQNFSSIDDFRDVESINKYAELLGEGLSEKEALAVLLAGSRDHARVGMPWAEGFSEAEPWIKTYPQLDITDEKEMADKDSIYNWYKALIFFRKEHKALVYGELKFVHESAKNYLAYFREDENEKFFIEMNLSENQIKRFENTGEYEIIFSNTSSGEQYLSGYEVNIYRVK